MKHILKLPLLLTLVVTACQDRSTPAAPGEISAAISDGAHGTEGNPDFFFLPPLVPNPSSNANFDAGRFNGRLHPVIAVYELLNDQVTGCTGTLKYGPVPAPVVPTEELYKLEWHTDASPLESGMTYRVCVFSSVAGGVLGTQLGFLDVTPVTGGMKNVRTGDTFAFQDGRVVPVKFRIEHGALSFDPENPTGDELGTEFTVGSAGGFATLASETTDEVLAAVFVPAGAVPTGEVTIVIAQEAPRYFDPETEAPQCLPGELVQSDWCYQLRTEPELYEFAQDVRVEICVDVSLIPDYADQLLVHKYNNEEEGVQALPWADPTLIGSDCSGPSELGAVGSPGQGIFARLGQWASRLLAPQALYAAILIEVPKGIGGLAGSFSDFGGAVPAPPDLPDLVVSSLNLQTTEVSPGGLITYDFTVSNVGGEGPTDNSTFDVATYLSSDAVLDDGDLELGWGYSAWTYHLTAGWSQSRTESDVVIPDNVPPGTYYLIVVADAKPDQQYPGVAEANESNNWRASLSTLVVINNP